MGSIVTANTLADFDLCLALAQTSIDTQMEYAWKAWKRRTNFSDRVNIFKLKRDGQLVDSSYGLSATLAPLQVGLNVADARLGQVRVTLTLTSGKVVYYDELTEVKAEYVINAPWSISFITDLDKKPVDLKLLQQIDPQAHEVAQDVIQTSGLPESVFSIEYLFLKLTDVDLMLASNQNVNIPADVPQSARNKALSVLNLLLQGELGEYLLGTVVRRNTRQATPTFAMTDFVFDVSRNWTTATASTLNYMGEFSGRPLPTDTSAARLKLSDAWVRPEQLDGRESNVSGIMAISKGVFLQKYLIPKIKSALDGFQFPSSFGASYGYQPGYVFPEPRRENLSWIFSDSHTATLEMKEFLRQLFDIGQGYELRFTVQPSSNMLQITGKLWSTVHYDGMTWLAPDKDNHTEWFYVDGHQDISGSLNLTGSGIGTDFNLGTQLQYSIGNPTIDRDEVGGFANVYEGLGSALKSLGAVASTPQELIRQGQQGLGQALQGTLEHALARLDVDLKQQTFIPPGGGVFTFQNPAFSPAADLFLDVIYRAP
jgi:hypothetical protein